MSCPFCPGESISFWGSTEFCTESHLPIKRKIKNVGGQKRFFTLFFLSLKGKPSQEIVIHNVCVWSLNPEVNWRGWPLYRIENPINAHFCCFGFDLTWKRRRRTLPSSDHFSNLSATTYYLKEEKFFIFSVGGGGDRFEVRNRNCTAIKSFCLPSVRLFFFIPFLFFFFAAAVSRSAIPL